MASDLEFLITLNIHHAGSRYSSAMNWNVGNRIQALASLEEYFDKQFDSAFEGCRYKRRIGDPAMAVCILKNTRLNLRFFVFMRIDRAGNFNLVTRFSREILNSIAGYLCRSSAENQRLKLASH